jgi:Uma2 family endonuclease
MESMTEPIGLASRPFTVADLEAMPDDGRRYELIDGMLHVTPGPSWSHQEMSAALFVLLRAQCPTALRVLMAPFAVRTSHLDEVQPDVIVAAFDDLTEKCLPSAPKLAVETLSPSTQLYDRNTKLAHYQRLGVESYWLLNPVQPGGLEAHQLDDAGTYQLLAKVSGDDVFTPERPFPVQVSPARLLDGLRPR